MAPFSHLQDIPVDWSAKTGKDRYDTLPPAAGQARLPSAFLSRTRLLDRLLGVPKRLHLLCAPGGYGKTALLSDCMGRQSPGRRRCWLSLNGQPTSLARFCERLAGKLRMQLPGCGTTHGLAVATLDALEASRETICLVLDDYPEEADVELDAWIDHLLTRSPARVQLWVSCRRRPAWRLSSLQLEGELLELGADDLAFTHDEFDGLANLLGAATTEAFRDGIWQRTLGWCAGSRLLLDDQGGGRPGALSLRDYLGSELLSRLGEDERTILIRLAHLPRVSAELCAQLWPELDGGNVFRDRLLPQALLRPMDNQGTWWRLLPAVAAALQPELNAAELGRLRVHSCRFLWDAGFADEAVEMALCADQADTAANYMDRMHPDWLFTDQHLATWLDWRTRLPISLLEGTPFLIYLNAQALLSSWRLDEARQCIARIGNLLPQPTATRNRRTLANWQALYGTLQGLEGNAEGAREHCHSALEHLDVRDWQSAYLCYSTLARVAMAAGEGDKAHNLLHTALELARRQGCLASEVLIDTDRIRLMILNGELDEAHALLDECFQLVAEEGGEHSLLLGRLHLLRGELALLGGDLDASEIALRRGEDHARECADPFILHARIGLSEVAACRGDYQQAGQHLREIERRMQCARVHADCYASTIAQQNLRVLARQEAWEQMLPQLRTLEQQARAELPPLHAPSLPQRIQLLQALALRGTGDLSEAEKELRALSQSCERLRFAGLLAEAGVALRQVEQELGWSCPEPREIRQPVPFSLLAKWATPPVASPGSVTRLHPGKQDVLTTREFSVLELLAEGLSNMEISERLYISLNTVKAHTIRINHKLGVKRRTQAVMRARVLGMLA
ncbi:ATP-, maltotriose-and DNA-dependent transcriptional regulator MalT [Pseudomonas jinjuensis]|uniref:ATP-, maltotriose-and DNA-dependent transcriptional regulator MalT n=2 Tax=Pseudomonas jinjuensis TaxID=198616 RepID=A0A1H0JNX7_9PSED|nr:ATP-, maltotriose-and DNA-dependent transcriptional regulator MalT [Pseudomonas jinjuensis]